MGLGIFLLGQPGRHVLGGEHIRHIGQQLREPDADQGHHRRAGGGDQGPDLIGFQHLPHRGGNDIRRPGHLEYVVEAQAQQGVEHVIHAGKVAELAV